MPTQDFKGTNNNAINTSNPAFLATVSAGVTDVTGDATSYTVVFGTVPTNQGSYFDGTSTFTAPVTGKYSFSVSLLLLGCAAAHHHYRLNLVTSNRTYNLVYDDLADASGIYIGGHVVSGAVHCADMDATDTAYVTLIVSGGTKIIDLDTGSFFCGSLIC
jgi:hypothetical protein